MTHAFRVSLATGAAIASLILLIAAAPIDTASPQEQQTRAHGLQLAGLFGESDEEKAARLAREQKEIDQDNAIGNLNTEVHDLQETVRRLTGQNETLTHQVQELNGRIDRMQKDFDYKLCTMTAQQVGGDASSLPCSGASDSASNGFAPPSQQGFTAPPSNNAPITLSPPPSTLGTLPRNTALPTPQSGMASSAAAGPAGSPYKAEFDAGLNLLAKAQYADATASFRTFADVHPKDSLAPQAVFWIGNIAYTQKDYATAARAFAEEIKKYPNNDRASESMLKLGKSLIQMGQKKQGCFTLASLSDTYPKAPKATLSQAAAERKASCSK